MESQIRFQIGIFGLMKSQATVVMAVVGCSWEDIFARLRDRERERVRVRVREREIESERVREVGQEGRGRSYRVDHLASGMSEEEALQRVCGVVVLRENLLSDLRGAQRCDEKVSLIGWEIEEERKKFDTDHSRVANEVFVSHGPGQKIWGERGGGGGSRGITDASIFQRRFSILVEPLRQSVH
jgi:hypothetical protein